VKKKEMREREEYVKLSEFFIQKEKRHSKINKAK